MDYSCRTGLVALALPVALSWAAAAAAGEVVKVSLWDKGPNSIMMDEAHMGGMGMGMGMKHMGDMPMAMVGISLDRAEVPAGEVTLEVANDGGEMIHELIVSPISSTDVVVPYDIEANSVDEDALSYLGEVEDLEPGMSGSLTLDLKPGAYLLYCNIPGHFANGMWAVLTVSG